ncbi:hypothetical protein ACTMTF_41655 [Nonomuraea sp. ZG12]|uniref:hypothetical protein n=1 Tax=Nonomuraea sp. ZG12 TaxID=3452207 RepID=UPI003F8A2E65
MPAPTSPPLMLLSHQLGEHALDHDERERLAAALAIAGQAIAVAGGSHQRAG